MTPTATLTTAMLAALGSDTTMLAGALWVVPIKTTFSPGPTPGLVDADMADFDGSTPKASGAATRPVLTDPATGQQYLRIPDPAGGWNWTTSGTTNLPQTIYGFALTSDSTTVEGADLLGTVRIPDQYLQSPAGQSFGAGEVTFTLISPALE